MQRFLIAFCLTVAPLAMAVALWATGYSAEHPAWWSASVQLAVLGGVTVMIYGINIHSVPAHSGRVWLSSGLVAAQVGAGVLGAWLAFFGRGLRIDGLDRAGQLLVTIGAVLFMTNLGLLFRQPGPPRPPKVPKAQRSNLQRVDRLAIPFTIISGIVVVAGTSLGLLLTWWRPGSGRWDLVWAHTMLLGFFFAMASGTSYHMLSRWTGAPWRSIRLVQVHLFTYLASFPLMLLALAQDIDWLFLIAGPLMAVSMLAWAANVVPMAVRLSGPVRWGLLMAMVYLAVGVGFGVLFAIDPGTGPRLRGTHVVANLYGFAGLLISGFGYAYVPRLSGCHGLRWPGLAVAQLLVLLAGVTGGMIAMGMRMYGEAGTTPVLVWNVIAAIGMVLFAIQVAGTFLQGREIASRPIMPSVTYGQN
jgi:hypothetical protein